MMSAMGRLENMAGALALGMCVVAALPGQSSAKARSTAKAPDVYSFADASGRQELRILRAGAGKIIFSFGRTRIDGCVWRSNGSAHRAGSSEIEGEDGYPLFFDRYNSDKGGTCEIFVGIEEATAARAQLNAGRRCGSEPTCVLDDPRSLMVLRRSGD